MPFQIPVIGTVPSYSTAGTNLNNNLSTSTLFNPSTSYYGGGGGGGGGTGTNLTVTGNLTVDGSTTLNGLVNINNNVTITSGPTGATNNLYIEGGSDIVLVGGDIIMRAGPAGTTNNITVGGTGTISAPYFRNTSASTTQHVQTTISGTIPTTTPILLGTLSVLTFSKFTFVSVNCNSGSVAGDAINIWLGGAGNFADPLKAQVGFNLEGGTLQTVSGRIINSILIQKPPATIFIWGALSAGQSGQGASYTNLNFEVEAIF